MNYGEETLDIKINRGLWITDTPEIIPDGFCSQFYNLIVNDDGTVSPRGRFEHVTSTTINTEQLKSSDTDPVYADGIALNLQRRLTALAGYQGIDPIVFDTFYEIMYSYNSSQTNKSTVFNIVGIYEPNSWCMYRDRLYGGSSSGIKRVSGWNFNAASVPVETLLATSPANTKGLIFFKSRLFGWVRNRLHWTDEITVGGYPETWNTAVNFADIPSYSTPTIHNIHIMNNTMYLFCQDGVYTLQVYGPPSSWVLKKVFPGIKTFSTGDSILSSDGSFIYYTDRRSVFAFNGESVFEIGIPIKEIFTWSSYFIVTQLNVFQKGFLLTIQQVEQYVDGFALNRAITSRVFYYTGTVWTEITIGVNTLIAVNSTFCNVRVPAWASSTDYLDSYVNLTVGTSYTAVNNYITKYNDNSYGMDLVTDVVQPSLRVPVKENLINMKKFKYGFLDLFKGVSNDLIYTSTYAPGIAVAEEALSTVGALETNMVLKFKLPQMSRRLSLRLRFLSVFATRGMVPFKIKKVSLVLNTHRTTPDHV